MHARSAVFDLYGDHLLSRDGWAPIAAIVRLMDAVGIAPSATRTAVSRMTREGWLATQERDGVRGYAATDRATRRLRRTSERIYAPGPAPWDGRWDVVVPDRVPDRARRARIAAGLGFLGYARLAPDTWIAPRRSPELAEVLAGAGWIGLTEAGVADPAALAARLWRLPDLADAHAGFTRWAEARMAQAGADPDDRAAYAVRARIVHERRKFLFTDPDLPAEVLPAGWPGQTATAAFLRHTATLAPGATRFVTRSLQKGTP